MSGSLFVRRCCADGWYADSGSKGDDCEVDSFCGRGVLGSAADWSSARGFCPVYLRGEGDLKSATVLARAARPLVCFFVEESFGVVCRPVTCVGESTLNSSSAPS